MCTARPMTSDPKSLPQNGHANLNSGLFCFGFESLRSAGMTGMHTDDIKDSRPAKAFMPFMMSELVPGAR